MTFELPMPPSTNNLFATVMVKGKPVRIPTRDYKAWKAEAADALGYQYANYGAPAVHKPVELRLQLGLGYRGDISNRLKAVEDLLVGQLDMPDDRYIERIVIERAPGITGALVTIAGGGEAL